MCAQSKPIGVDFSEAAQKRHSMVEQYGARLQHFAYRAQHVRCQTNTDVVVVCIKVGTCWQPIVDILMPGYNWQAIRDQGQEPVALGTANFTLGEVIAESIPELAEFLLETPKEGFYKCIALDEGGCTVYDIEPKEQK